MNSNPGMDQQDADKAYPTRDNATFLYNAQQETAKTKSNLIQIPSVSLPKGGGAIKSIDEKFTVNAVNGTASFSIPLPFSPGRNGAAPGLSLSYNSGGGNSIFGLGWNCDFPSIQRRTDKRLPEYKDKEESDTFLFSGAEDLVPELIKDSTGKWQKNSITNNGVTTTSYRPRIEGLFARIEKIDDNNNDVYWRIRTKDNVVTIFGQSTNARITSPTAGEGNKIFKWLPEYSYDDKGNITKYIYKQEDKKNILPAVNEKNRLNNTAPFTNIYLKNVLYSNKTAFYEGDPIPGNTDFLFELLFDFGEHDAVKPTTQETADWPARMDSFSDYHSGFEIRTCRLCRRILMFHHFKDELGWNDYLVRSLDFSYDEHPHLTYIEQITQTGYIWNTDGTLTSKRSLPPLAFTYRKPGFSRTVKEIAKEQIANDPVGLDNQVYQWTDLYSEGISGILSEQATGWFYKENLGEGNFSPAKQISAKPSLTGISTGTLSIQDLEANGKKYFVKTDATIKGFFGFDSEEEWEPFTAFREFPNIDLKDPNLKFLDLNGDGRPDILISHELEFIWYAAKGKLGYDCYQSAYKTQDEEKGPAILFANADKSILVAVADMSGDGLADILIIANSNVFYYPNLGFGCFGARVTMQMNGSFDADTDFNPQFVHLADIDGSGTTDIIYTGKNKIQVWFNQSGNSLKDPDEFFNPFPEIDDRTNISFVDLLGNGTSCLVWSSPLPASASAPLRYIDLMDGKKPHVMEKYVNNLGKEITVNYQSSTQYYLADKAKGKKWITRLPFPVQCVSMMIVEDKISQTRFTNSYTYHHGYYDAIEREFRGFAMVETQDCEEYDNYIKTTNGNTTIINNKDLFQPLVTTKTWFHTGAFLNREKMFHQLQEEYYQLTNILPEINPAADLTAIETVEYCRALKGLPLRQEVYSNEGDAEIQLNPYTVTQHNYDIQMLQPKAGQRYAVFLSHEKETLTLNLERNPLDPRILHNINVEIDAYGNVLQSASMVYGRTKADAGLPTDADRQCQTRQYVTYTLDQYTNGIDSPAALRLPQVCEIQTWELNTAPPANHFFTSDEIGLRFANATEILYEQVTATNQKRKFEHAKTLFLRDDLSAPMPFAFQDTRALPYANYLLAFTPSLVQSIYGAKFDEGIWRNQALYVKVGGDNNYWINSGRTYFHPDLSADPFATTIAPPTAADVDFAKSNFFMPVATEDNFGNLTKVFYDKYKLLMQRIIDAAKNETNADAFNYRVVAAYLLRDANNNRTGVRFDELGHVTRTFVMGKETEFKGDPMDTSSAELSNNDQPSTMMDYAFRYFDTNGQLPNRILTTVYERHYYQEPQPAGSILNWLASLFGGSGSNIVIETDRKPQQSYSYSDGSGHEVMKKMQAAPGMAPQRDANGQLVHDANGNLQYQDTSPDLRWVGNGRSIMNNKGKPVKQYEAFFDSSFEFNDEKQLVELGFTPIIYYDAPGRVIKIEKPNGTFSKMEFDAWMQKVYDENDTVTDSSWYAERINGAAGEAQQEAAQKAAVHYNTPGITYLDSLGRVFLSVADNKTQRSNETVLEELYYTRTGLDIEGNALTITDARGNLVMSWKYDMLGNIVYQHSMDAGDRWMLADVTDKPLRLWDSRQQLFSYVYDALHRPLNMMVNTGSGNILFEQYEYGENAAGALTYNLKGKSFKQYDTAGIVTIAAYDFKGNPLATSRQLLKDYKNAPAWDTNPALETETFSSENSYDALNRSVKTIAPDNSIFMSSYDQANLLNRVDVNIGGSNTVTNFVSNINYNAKGQREEIFYGNNTKTAYTYDPETYRLTGLLTTTGGGNLIVQDFNYTFDPVGNITRQFDNAQKSIFYGGQQVEAQSDYGYDAIYRLIEASGREHTGQIGWTAQDNWNDNWCRLTLQPNSPIQLRNYTQKYFYDPVGNISKMQHIAGSLASFTRTYNYNQSNNQLTKTSVGSQSYSYAYNEHGSMLTMPNLQQIQWDFREEMQNINLGGGGQAYYVYDISGQRIRKVIERPGNKKEERIYLGPFEIYRERTGNTITLERETLHIMDDKSRVAMIDTRTKGNDGTAKQLIRYQYGNHLGTACLELDADAKIITYEEYHPFGTTAYQATDASRQVPKKRYRYAGLERDEESGFNYHKQRYYVNWLGRWMNTDPIGIKDDINIYAYAHDNPIIGADTNGMWLFIVAIIVGVIAGVCTSSPANAPETVNTPLEPRVSELRVVANVTMGVTAVVTAPAVLAHPVRAAVTMAVASPVIHQGHQVANRLDPSGNASAALDIAVTVGMGALATRAPKPTLTSEPEPILTPNEPPPPEPVEPPVEENVLPEGEPANDNATPIPANDNALPLPANDNAIPPEAANDNALASVTPISEPVPVEEPLARTGTDDGPTCGGGPNRTVNMAGGRRGRGGDDSDEFVTRRTRPAPDRRVRTEDERNENTSSSQTVNLRSFFQSNIRSVLARAGKDVPDDLNKLWDQYTLFARGHEEGHFHLSAPDAMVSLENFVAQL